MTRLSEVEAFWEKVCFDPHYQPEGRFKTYRDLVFEGMLEVLQNICPVTGSILSDAEIKKLFWDFLLSSPPQSPVLRRLPWEISQYLRRNPHPLLSKYPWLGELMEYEYLEVQVRFAEEEESHSSGRGLISLNPAHALGEYSWPVHFISEKNHESSVLPRGSYYLFLWREPQGLEVKFMEVNALVAVIVRKLQRGPIAVTKLLKETAEEVCIPMTEEYLEEGHGLIQSFLAQGILKES